MYTLYYMPGACSMAVHVILNELKQDVKLVNVAVADGQPRSADFLKLNPRGNVPVLVDGDAVIREGGAIITYLLDKHSSPMLPKSGADRAKALEWIMFANATMHPAYGKVFFGLKSFTDAAVKEAVIKAAIAGVDKNWAEVETQLNKTKYVTGNEVSAADILFTVFANWGNYFPQYHITIGEKTKLMLKDIVARPSYQKALEQEKVEYKIAA